MLLVSTRERSQVGTSGDATEMARPEVRQMWSPSIEVRRLGLFKLTITWKELERHQLLLGFRSGHMMNRRKEWDRSDEAIQESPHACDKLAGSEKTPRFVAMAELSL